MSNIIKFDSDSNLPAYLSNGAAMLDINNEVVRSPAFPSMSIKGMKFTAVRDGSKTVLTKPDDPDEVAQSIGVVMVRINMNAKTFYAKKYVEGDSDGARPDCYSYDGVAPSANSTNPQAAKCAICPNNVWGSRMGDGDRPGEERKGKACNDNVRVAISAPDQIDPMLLRVPPKSIGPLREMLKSIKARKYPYNAVVVKMGFDRNEPSPVLTFKPVGLLDDKMYAKVTESYDSEVTRAITGMDDSGHPASEAVSKSPRIEMDELDAAIATRTTVAKAAESAKAKPVMDDDLDDILTPAKPAPKAEVKAAKAKPAPKEYDNGGGEDDLPAAPPKPKGGSSLLSDLDDLLGNTDD